MCVCLRASVSLSVLSARVCVCVSACVRARVCSHNQHSTALASSCLPPSGLWLLAPPRSAPSLPALATSQHPSPRYLPWSVAVGSRRLGARALRAARATTRRAPRALRAARALVEKRATTSGDEWNERGQWFQVWRYWGEMEDIFCSAKGVWQAKGAGGSAATQNQQSYPHERPTRSSLRTCGSVASLELRALRRVGA